VRHSCLLSSAWIRKVHVTATQLNAGVQGTAVEGAELELFGLADRSQQRLDGPDTITHLLSEGLSASA
jgi:hypothetical protein